MLYITGKDERDEVQRKTWTDAAAKCAFNDKLTKVVANNANWGCWKMVETLTTEP